MSMMPGYTVDPEWLGIKVVSVFPRNFGTELYSHQGMVLLFSPDNGQPVAIIDGREITAIRTAAATAAATDVLASPDVKSLGVFGYGEQAETHVTALSLVRAFDEILVYGRDFARAKEFVRRVGSENGSIRAVNCPEDAAACDVVCTVTASTTPVFSHRWLRPGQHLAIVGSSIPTSSEIDVETVAASRLFVDFTESALALGGEIRNAIDAGMVTADHIVGTVGDVLRGTVAAREQPADITLFKSLGMVAQDLVACDHVLRRADAQSAGCRIDW